VERVLLLQASPMLAHATGAQLLRLAAARTVPLVPGTDPLAGLSEMAMLLVLSGTATVTTSNGTALTADAGDVIGMYQVLSGQPAGFTVSAAAPGAALCFLRGDLFDVLADKTALLQAVFAGLLHAAHRG
jgi:CRP-like cAMP-binding protein